MNKLIIGFVLAMLSFGANAGYADIGYKKDLSIDVMFNAASFVYVKAELDGDLKTAGIGIGHQAGVFEMALIASHDINGFNDKKVELGMLYTEPKINVFGWLGKRLKSTGFTFKVGAGYALNEKVRVITYYTRGHTLENLTSTATKLAKDDSVFFGLRRVF